MDKLEKLFGLGDDVSENDDTELVDATNIATELLPTDRVGPSARTDVSTDDLSIGFDDTAMAPSHIHARTSKTPRRSAPKPQVRLSNPAPLPPQYDDEDDWDDDDDAFDQTDIVPIKNGDIAATLLGQAIDGRFRLHGLLGEGGMGRVYRGEQISIGRPVAIKVIKQELVKQDDLRKRFLREAKLISTFTHPNIVRLIDFGELPDGRLYLAMEFVNGLPISDLFINKKMHPRYALEMIRQVSSALIEAHDIGVIHRDIKPDNIFLTRIADGSVQFKVLDFGVARTSTSTLTAKGAVCGTPAYMAPEQARGLEVDAATDLYSLGIMLYEALTGELPYLHSDPFKLMLKQCQDPVPDVRSLAPHVPDDVAEVVTALLSKLPDDRIRTSTQLCDTIEHLAQQNGWGATIRLPAGPLLETTKGWLWTSASAAAEGMLMGQSNWLMSSKLDSESPAPEMGGYDPNFDSIELDLPSPVPHTPANLHAVAPSREPINTPGPIGLALEPSPTAEVASPRVVSAPTRMERRMTPAPYAEMTPASTSQPVLKPKPKKTSTGNQGLIILLAGLLVIAGCLGAFVFYKASQPTISDEVYLTEPAQADGEAQEVFRILQHLGWEITQPYGNTHSGITTYTAKARKDNAIVSVTVDQYMEPEDAQVRYRGIPSFVYWYDTTVITVKAFNAIAGDLDQAHILESIMFKKPGGKLTR